MDTWSIFFSNYLAKQVILGLWSEKNSNRPISSCINLTWNLLSKVFINLDLCFRQNLFPKLVIAQDNARFRIENIYSNFWHLCWMHADGKSTLASVSKWNSGKVNYVFINHIMLTLLPTDEGGGSFIPHQSISCHSEPLKVNRLGTWPLSKIKGKSKISVWTCGFYLKSLTDKFF